MTIFTFNQALARVIHWIGVLFILAGAALGLYKAVRLGDTGDALAFFIALGFQGLSFLAVAWILSRSTRVAQERRDKKSPN